MSQPETGKLLGVDYGTKRIGLALADSETKIATPHKVIENNKEAVGTITKLCEKRNIQVIILGESKDFRGRDNPVMSSIKEFKQILENKLDIEIIYEPEFFTSLQARQQPDTPEQVDGSAAALILQSYFNKNHG